MSCVAVTMYIGPFFQREQRAPVSLSSRMTAAVGRHASIKRLLSRVMRYDRSWPD